MDRKTNLFYNSGQDSNFLTFSNYTEALTGNIIATNAKMFPAKFLCVYVPALDKSDGEEFKAAKETFIDNLICYYENKLAALRDLIPQAQETRDGSGQLKVEEYLNPLDYLLETLYKYGSGAKVTHIGYICEQEYNGVFNDNICIVEASAEAKEYGIIQSSYRSGNKNINATSDGGKLHGWSNYSAFDNYSPIYDSNENVYATGSHMDLQEDTTSKKTSIDFNVIIPLFNVYNWDEDTQAAHYYDLETPNPDPIVGDTALKNNVDSSKSLIINSGNTKNHYDIPLGIWISDKVISLERNGDASKTYRPSWSLCISSQFKPFPYSNIQTGLRDSDNLDIYGTFAMIMSKQGFIMNEFKDFSYSIANLSSRIDNLTSVVNSIETGSSGGSSGTGSSEDYGDIDINGIYQALGSLEIGMNNLTRQFGNLSGMFDTFSTSGFITLSDLDEKHFINETTFTTNISNIINNFNSYVTTDSMGDINQYVGSYGIDLRNIKYNMYAYWGTMSQMIGKDKLLGSLKMDWNDISNGVKQPVLQKNPTVATSLMDVIISYSNMQSAVNTAVDAASVAAAQANAAVNAIDTPFNKLERRLSYVMHFLEDRFGAGSFNFNSIPAYVNDGDFKEFWTNVGNN